MKIHISPPNSRRCIENKESDLLKLILKNGFLTGSRKFKLEHEESDWDYIMKYDDDLAEHINIHGLVMYNDQLNGDPTLSFRMLVETETYEKNINVLVILTDKEYKSWIKSTEQFLVLMKSDLFKNVVEDKDIRIAIFERLRNLNGGSHEIKTKIPIELGGVTLPEDDEPPF